MDSLSRGQRIARARRRRGLSQTALAGLIGRSESWLSQVERGLRDVDSHSVLTSLAALLKVEVTELTGGESTEPSTTKYTAAREIERAMMAYDSLDSIIDASAPVREPEVAGRKNASQARDLIATAVGAVQRSGASGDPERLSVLGSLLLADALAAAHDFDRAAADRSLAAAKRVADEMGQDRNDHWTAFGPSNVQIHELSVAVAAGDATTAVETGESIDLQHLPAGLGGRRSQVSLDLARAYAQQRYDAAAVNMLLAAEQTAPQLVRYDGSTHDLIATLLRREHRASTPQLRPLAHRAGLV